MSKIKSQRIENQLPTMSIEDKRDEIPTMMITTPDNYLVLVGDPKTVSNKELADYAKKGYTIKTVPFKEYRTSNIKWIYDRPKK
jgi:hypothetical protein